MQKSGFRFLLALALLLPPLPAAAAPPKTQMGQSFDQYPSFIELTTSVANGTQTVLRCGYYSPDGQTVALDPKFEEISAVNTTTGEYSRLQHVDNYLIATSPASHQMGILVELVQPDGSTKAKSCLLNTDNDKIYDCHHAQPRTPVDQIKLDDRQLGSQCLALLKQGKAQIDVALASPEKTEAFMAGLRQKIGTLINPK